MFVLCDRKRDSPESEGAVLRPELAADYFTELVELNRVEHPHSSRGRVVYLDSYSSLGRKMKEK